MWLLLQIFEDSIRLQSIWTNARELLEKGELKTPEHSSDEEEEEKPVPAPKSASKPNKKSKSKSKKEVEEGVHSSIDLVTFCLTEQIH